MTGPQAPKDYVDLPDLDPLDSPPDPFAEIRGNLKIKVYLWLILVVVIATGAIWYARIFPD